MKTLLFAAITFALALPACSLTEEQWLDAGTKVASAAASGAAAGFTSGLASRNRSGLEYANVGPWTATK